MFSNNYNCEHQMTFDLIYSVRRKARKKNQKKSIQKSDSTAPTWPTHTHKKKDQK